MENINNSTAFPICSEYFLNKVYYMIVQYTNM